MTTHSTVYPETNVSASRIAATDGHSATDGLEAAVPELKAKLQKMLKSSKTRVTEWRDGVQGGVRAKPIQSVLIAVAVGAVIGLLVGRRIS